jgi:hypothetical protein
MKASSCFVAAVHGGLIKRGDWRVGIRPFMVIQVPVVSISCGGGEKRGREHFLGEDKEIGEEDGRYPGLEIYDRSERYRSFSGRRSWPDWIEPFASGLDGDFKPKCAACLENCTRPHFYSNQLQGASPRSVSLSPLAATKNMTASYELSVSGTAFSRRVICPSRIASPKG